MRLEEARDKIIDDHTRLRGRLDVIERLTERVLTGESSCGDSFFFECETMFADLAQHIHWEDRNLAPALIDHDAKRGALLEQDHREQRLLMRYVIDRLRDPTRPAVLVARTMLDFGIALRQDMRREEVETLLPCTPHASAQPIEFAIR